MSRAYTIDQLLDERGVLLADGAMGTNLMAAGLPPGTAPEAWNLAAPDRVAALHSRFVAAGADVLLTNTFGARERAVVTAGVTLARRAADAAERAILVAGSIGPNARDEYAAQARALAEAGVDFLWLETFSSFPSLSAALAAARATALPYVVTFSFHDDATSPRDAAAFVLSNGAPAALGANCGTGPGSILAVLPALAGACALPLVAKASCGLPEETASPEEMARYALQAREAGARIIGGCCGTTPAHTTAMRAALDAQR